MFTKQYVILPPFSLFLDFVLNGPIGGDIFKSMTQATVTHNGVLSGWVQLFYVLLVIETNITSAHFMKADNYMHWDSLFLEITWNSVQCVNLYVKGNIESCSHNVWRLTSLFG